MGEGLGQTVEWGVITFDPSLNSGFNLVIARDDHRIGVGQRGIGIIFSGQACLPVGGPAVPRAVISHLM